MSNIDHRVASGLESRLERSVTGSEAPALRTARRDDLAAVRQLLTDAHLPTDDLDAVFSANVESFVVADDPRVPGALAAVGGLEVCGDSALLRSVAVSPTWQERGLGQSLVHRLVEIAEDQDLHALYLLTMTADRYFPRFGFERVAREAVPAEIAATEEFRSACPASAVAMSKSLAR